MVSFQDAKVAKAGAGIIERLSRLIFAKPHEVSSLSSWWKPATAFAVLLLLILGGLWLWRDRAARDELVRVPSTPAPSSTSPKSGELAGNNQQERAPVNQAAPSPSRNEALVARSLLPRTATGPDDFETRGGWDRKAMGKPLKEVRHVHIQLISDNELAKGFSQELRARLAGGIVTTSSVDDADAALKISVQRASNKPDETRVIVVVRAVNANGYLLWPDPRRGGSWKYVGQPGNVAQRVASDLSSAVQR